MEMRDSPAAAEGVHRTTASSKRRGRDRAGGGALTTAWVVLVISAEVAECAGTFWCWVGMGYAALAGVFAVLTWRGLSPDATYAIVRDPLMVLIGGSLTIAKDLAVGATHAAQRGRLSPPARCRRTRRP